mgnify:CR=1 FL=1
MYGNVTSGGRKVAEMKPDEARAVILKPKLLLADEPTGNLDSTTGHEVMNILRELHASGRTIVLITHDPSVAQNASRQIHVLDGRIVQ